MADMSTESLVDLLERAEDLPGVVALRARSYDLLRLDQGAVVVDVGCGSGRAVAELAERGAVPIGVDPDDAMLTRRIVHARADAVRNPRAARRYRALLLDAGFTDVAVEIHTAVTTGKAMVPMLITAASIAAAAGAITAAQAETWTREQRARAAADRMFVALPVFVVAA